jgi:hypothetical protein
VQIVPNDRSSRWRNDGLSNALSRSKIVRMLSSRSRTVFFPERGCSRREWRVDKGGLLWMPKFDASLTRTMPPC